MPKPHRRKAISLEALQRRWMRDPKFKAAYDALEEEFALAETIIRARAGAKLTQAELAARMGTSQAFVARLESGRSLPTMRTLRRVGEATGTRPKVELVPVHRR